MNQDTVQDQRASHPHPAPKRHSVGRWWMGVCLALPPIVWFIQLSIDEIVSSQACYPDGTPLLQPQIAAFPVMITADVVLLIVAAIGILVGWRNWRRTADEKPGGGSHLIESGSGRTRFMAMSGVLTSGLVFIAGLYALLAHLSVAWCGT